MDVLGKEESYTIEDIYALPDGERAALIDGKIHYMSPTNTRYQMLVSVICDKDKITEKGCQGAPDWVIEIVFPSSCKMDYFNIELPECGNMGWLILTEQL